MERVDRIAIVWAPHEARTAAYASWLGATLFNVHFLKARRPWLAPIKYVLQSAATWWLLARRRPKIVFVTNSPPFAGLCVQAYARLTGAHFVLDIHPPSLYNRKWRWSRPLHRFTARHAEVVLTDQRRFADLIGSWGADVLVLENPPKVVPDLEPIAVEDDEVSFAYVGTFADDEPVDILLEAGRRLPHVTIYLLGNPELARRAWRDAAPPNVVFTGYLLKEAYWDRLRRARAVIVLTTHEHSLLGGAQDGLHIDTPLVLSDQPTLREYFVKGTVFIDNTADGAVAGLEEVLRNESRLRREIAELHPETSQRWKDNFAALEAIFDRHAPRSGPN